MEVEQKVNRMAVEALRALLLLMVLVAGGYLRLVGLNWDEGQWIHPDEGHMRIITSAIHTPDDRSVYFDTHRSPLNCRNNGYQYSYGTLPLFLVRITGEWLNRGCGEEPDRWSAAVGRLLLGERFTECRPGAFTGSDSALVGRMFSALADLGTVVLLYLLGRQLYGEDVGLLAATLGALTAFLIQQAHFFTVDSMGCFFVTLTAYLAVRAGQSGRWGTFALAGLTTGLAAACKVDGVSAALFVVLAAAWRLWVAWDEGGLEANVWAGLGGRLVLAGLLAAVAFRVAQPYAFEGPGFFGVRFSPEWLDRLRQIRAEQSGQADLPSGRQWTNRTPIVFFWLNMVVWGMGLPLGLAAWAGWALIGLETWRGKRHQHLILWGWGTLLFLYQSTRWVKAMRYGLSLYPLFVLMAAYLLRRLVCGRMARWRRWAGMATATVVVVGTAVWGYGLFSIYLRPHTRLAASRWIFEHVPVGSVVANEHWDWGLPLRVDGHDPFGGMYTGIEMQNYNEDTVEKREQLFDWLDQADYIFLASNRLYASIARLPARYPLTTAYYRSLFAGELGFELVADFTSRPAIGPFQFPDQECPYPLMEPTEYVYQTEPVKVYLPPAEEAFSVYDHPRVLIFRKTERYSRELVEEVLGGIDVQRALHGLTPRQATAAPDLLEFDREMWEAQQAGGTWSEMFHRGSLPNRHPWPAAVLWWLAVTVLGWLAFPLLFVALPRLRERGYGLARVLGLLLVAYFTWLVAGVHILPNTRGTVWRGVVLLAVVGGGVGLLHRGELRRFLLRRGRLLLLMEVLFAVLYFFWVWVRSLQPDLWHPVVGGEKPMDFAYLNAVMKSTWFPPYNPWYSGSYINYYYFGFVIVGTLVKGLGTVPAIAYNLAVPLLFALTGLGAFTVAYDLFGGRGRGPLVAGLTALTFAVLVGNLGVVHLVRVSLIELGGEAFSTTVPFLADTVSMFKGLWQVVAHGATLALRPESWYWHPTRIIPAWEGEVGPISEFPAFTFLYGDLHAHMIAFPLTLLALLLAVGWVRDPRPRRLSLLWAGLVIGALRPTNTWDYPTYLALGLVALVIGGLRRDGGKGALYRAFGWVVALVMLTVVLYLPYIQHYAAGYSSVERWRGSHTPLNIYLWIHGMLLFPVLTRLVLEVRRRSRCDRRAWVMWLAVGGAVLVGLVLYGIGCEVALLTLPVGVLTVYLLFTPGVPADRRLLWFVLGTAMALGLVVEVLVLKGDIGRMNTVFKFYLQVWLLLSVAGGAALGWVWEFSRRWHPDMRTAWWTVMGVLVFGGALFLPYGIRARANDRMAPETGRTLDGMAFMRYGVVFDGDAAGDGGGAREIPLAGDYAAIRWMQDNIVGSPVIVEGLGHREYLWGSRVSIYTGLPAVVGWRWHEVQQRAVLPAQMVDWRRDDVREFYNTSDVGRAMKILADYGVRYVYVGEYEKAYYLASGLSKFDRMVEDGVLRVVYDRQGVRIYEVVNQRLLVGGDGGAEEVGE